MNRIFKTLVFFLLFQTSIYAQVTKIFDFTGSTTVGKEPLGGLISDGTFLYGMTQWGGANNKGTIFKIKSDGTNYSLLHSFDNINGEEPHGDLVLINGVLYGSTVKGGTNNQGVIFKINTDGSNFSRIFNFTEAIVVHIITDGTLIYGTSSVGDNNSANGNGQVGFVFKMNADGTNFTILKQFEGTFGASPNGKLLLINNYLYGVTTYGSSNSSGGIVYKLKTDASDFSVIYQSTQGGINSIITDGTWFYLTTDFGGYPAGDGSIFKIKIDGTNFQMLKDFSYNDGSEPSGNLYIIGNDLYGMTNDGGTSGDGTFYKINKDGTNFQTLYNCSLLNGNKGTNPRGGFLQINNDLFGMMQLGGASYVGTIFKYQLSSTGITDMHSEFNSFVYPNPTNNLLFINSEISNSTFSIVNSLGQHIVTDQKLNNNQIDVHNLPNGIYNLIIKSENHITNTYKFIKK